MPHVTSHTPGTPCWIDLMSPDVDAARAFYGALLGWDFDVSGAETGHYTLCSLAGRAVAGIGKMPPDAPFPSAWSVYFASEDVDATAAAIGEAGGQVVMGPMDIPGAGRMLFCAGPTGAHFGVWEAGAHRGAGVIDEPGAMAWREVNTRDATQARDFYAQVFGFTPHRLEGMDYWTLNVGDKAHAGVLQMTDAWPEDIPPHWMTYFAVVDTDDVAARAAELGGRVAVPPFDSPYGKIAVVQDPGGATFSIVAMTRG